ncbi:hypothetical protein, partial [Planomonospora algeriensis]
MCLLVFLLTCVAAKMPMAGLVRGGRFPGDPFTVLLVGISACGLTSTLVFSHPGGSQGYFLGASYPYIWVLVACGAGMFITTRAGVLAFAAAAAAGAGVMSLVRHLSSPEAPVAAVPEEALGVVGEILTPYLLLAAVPLSALLVRLFPVRATSALGSLVVASGVVSGYALPAVAGQVRFFVGGFLVPPPAPWEAAQEMIPRGAFPAARRLRRLSSPDDLVATNAHCRV